MEMTEWAKVFASGRHDRVVAYLNKEGWSCVEGLGYWKRGALTAHDTEKAMLIHAKYLLQGYFGEVENW